MIKCAFPVDWQLVAARGGDQALGVHHEDRLCATRDVTDCLSALFLWSGRLSPREVVIRPLEYTMKIACAPQGMSQTG